MPHLDAHTKTIDACHFCPMCRHVCTVANAVHLESTSPRGWALSCYALAAGMVEPGEMARSERIFQCAGCDRCYDDCISNFRPSEAFGAVRADLVEAGLAPQVVKRVGRRVTERGNPFGESAEMRSLWRSDHNLPNEGEVLFFAGCEIVHRRQEIADALIKICDAASVKLAVLEDEHCCAAPLHNLGFLDAARNLAQINITAISESGCRAVVFGCPTCLRQVTQVYREVYGLDTPPGVEMLHMSQFLQRLLEDGRLGISRRAQEVVTYHDPCTLGRAGLGIYDPPRAVLRAMGAQVAEPELSREHAVCCGSATLHQTYPDIARLAASNALNDLTRAGASALITACPACKSAFLPQAASTGHPVTDLAEAVANVL